MNILICAAYFRPHVGGYEKNIEELTKRLLKRGHKIDILTHNTNKSYTYEAKVTGEYIIHRLPSWDLLNKTYPVPVPSKQTFKMLKRLFNYPYDVVVTQTRFFSSSLIGYIISKVKKIPLIHVERGSCHSVATNKITETLVKIYDHTIGSLILKSTKANIGVSDKACEFIKHLNGNHARVIYNGIEPCKSYRFIGQTDYKVITFVGRLVYAKGVQDLIKAVEILHNRYKADFRLLIIGEGNYKNALVKQARMSKCSNKIAFLGELEPNSIYLNLMNTNVFVNPSYSEGLPTSVMEAVSAGVPVVATDVGGTREILHYGWFIKPGNIEALAGAILICLQNKDIVEENAKEDKEKADKKFDWNNITNQWDELLKEIVGEKNEQRIS